MPSASDTWNRYTELQNRMHTAPTAEEREAAKREKLSMLISATYTARIEPRVHARP